MARVVLDVYCDAAVDISPDMWGMAASVVCDVFFIKVDGTVRTYKGVFQDEAYIRGNYTPASGEYVAISFAFDMVSHWYVKARDRYEFPLDVEVSMVIYNDNDNVVDFANGKRPNVSWLIPLHERFRGIMAAAAAYGIRKVQVSRISRDHECIRRVDVLAKKLLHARKSRSDCNDVSWDFKNKEKSLSLYWSLNLCAGIVCCCREVSCLYDEYREEKRQRYVRSIWAVMVPSSLHDDYPSFSESF